MNTSGKIISTVRSALLYLCTIVSPILLSGCSSVVLNPSGDIALQQGNLLIISTMLMMLIIVPVIALIGVFAWKYRHSNTEARYEPDWDHSTSLEFIIWGAPLMIIIVLGLLTWIGTHTLDPYRKLGRIDADRPVPANVRPLRVEVVALDWKWLFIYPDLNIATVNELAAPVDVPIEFHITASTVMNSFSIPALAGQIYAMPGMQTTLNAVINKAGVYDGFSANYSGAGFSDMKFKFHGLDQAAFDQWVQAVRAEQPLDVPGYVQLEKPSLRVPVRYFSAVDASLYHKILNRCVDGNAMCMDQMVAEDAQSNQRAVARSDKPGNAVRLAKIDICTTTPSSLKVKNNARAN